MSIVKMLRSTQLVQLAQQSGHVMSGRDWLLQCHGGKAVFNQRLNAIGWSRALSPKMILSRVLIGSEVSYPSVLSAGAPSNGLFEKFSVNTRTDQRILVYTEKKVQKQM